MLNIYDIPHLKKQTELSQIPKYSRKVQKSDKGIEILKTCWKQWEAKLWG